MFRPDEVNLRILDSWAADVLRRMTDCRFLSFISFADPSRSGFPPCSGFSLYLPSKTLSKGTPCLILRSTSFTGSLRDTSVYSASLPLMRITDGPREAGRTVSWCLTAGAGFCPRQTLVSLSVSETSARKVDQVGAEVGHSGICFQQTV